jgi:probable rRNA maturation factor
VNAAPFEAPELSARLDILQAPGVELPAGLQPEDWIKAALSVLDCPTASMSLRWVDEVESAALNQQYRGKSGPTNVLAFPAPQMPGLPAGETDYLGDLVVCVPVLLREAAEQGKSPNAHAAHLLVHGCLHLAGYQHECADQREVMEQLEIRLLAQLGFADPYQLRADGRNYE